MKLNDLPRRVMIFGDTSYRGQCNQEEVEQIDFFAWLKLNYPDYYQLAIHPKNEGRRSYAQAAKDAALGSISTGASDVIIPAGRAFICEIKRKNHTKSRWEKGQKEYLINASNFGAFSCVALGCEAAKEAFKHFLYQTGF